MEAPNLPVTFDCSVSLEAGRLKVVYSVHNHSGGDVGLFNRILGVNLDDTRDFSPQTVYVDLEDSTLHLRKMVLPIPPGLKMSERPVPYLTWLPDQQTFREEFFVPLPAPVRNPLRRALLATTDTRAEVIADKPVKVQSVAFSLGVFKASPDIRFLPAAPAFPGVFRVWPPGPAIDRQVVLSKTVRLPAPITVLDYRLAAPNTC